MGVLIAGLVLLLGVHSIRLIGLRPPVMGALGPGFYAVVYSLISAVGLALIVYGHILAHPSEVIYTPPVWTRTLALFAVPLALILTVSAYMPTHIRARLRHPMTIGVLIFAGAHLAANGELANIVLFGSFTVWAVIALIEAYWRGGVFENPGTTRADLAAIVIGLVLAGLLSWFHMQLFGVAVIGFASETTAPGI